MKRHRTGRIINVGLLLGFCFLCVYPYWNVVIYALNDSTDALKGSLYLFPRVPTLFNFSELLKNIEIVRAFGVSLFRTAFGVVTSVVMNAMFAYAFSKKYLVGRNFIKWMVVIPLYFAPGIVPMYIVLKQLHLTNSLLTYIIPHIYGSYIIIILHSFFVTIPRSLEEAARIDGAGDGMIFFRIVWPTSKPVLAYIALFQALWHWNDWFIGATYVFDQKIIPVQTLLLNMIKERAADVMIDPSAFAEGRREVTARSLQMAMIVITTVPILLVYPFLQKYFVQGIMIGSIKG